MPSLDDLKKRIKSVKSTQKITKAMKMVAAAKLRKAQESAEKGRPYSQKMQNIILNLTKSINDPQNAPKLLVGTGEDKQYLCVVLTADRGLCGGFNSNICKLAKTYFYSMKLAYWMYAGPAHIGTLRVASSFKNVHAIMHAPLGDDYFNVMRSMLERERDFTPVTASIVDRHVLARGSEEKVVQTLY